MGSTTFGTYMVPANSVGVTYSLSSFPGGMQMIVTNGTATDGTNDYCYTLPGPSGTVMWSQLKSQCYLTPPGPSIPSPPNMLSQIKFQAGGGMNPQQNVNFCVTALSL
jgi:hypothetical protein